MQSSVRRKILRFLMLMGSAGLTSAVATLILAFIKSDREVDLMGFGVNAAAFNVMTIFLVLLVVFLISRTEFFDEFIRRMLKKPLQHIKAKVNLYDFEKVLGLSQGNSIVSFDVPKNHWMVNKSIGKLKLEKEGVLVLGIFRKVGKEEQYIATPSDGFKRKGTRSSSTARNPSVRILLPGKRVRAVILPVRRQRSSIRITVR
ncbi:MAG: hypothetical protein ACQESG_04295 [Nanobdellota archaeon]